jgi:redox-sensitive bicupin YhaK (pirin superfamily)
VNVPRRNIIKNIFALITTALIGEKMNANTKKTNESINETKKEHDTSKKVLMSGTNEAKHWVGDGFHVHNLLRPAPNLDPHISPFLLMDYAAPKHFETSTKPRGVGEHPHRGFETVTFAYQGEVEHKDSHGGGGTIKPGDVQWMTAGSGLVHEEFHSKNFTQNGGTFEMVQLWVNLPKKDKMTAPRYQSLENKDIVNINLSDTSELRVIAGSYNDKKGPAKTFTNINVYDLASSEDNIKLPLSDGTNTLLLIMRGSATIDDKEYPEKTIVIFNQRGDHINFKTSKDFKALILNGDPINEPVVAHGPFVMNSKEEIIQAMTDYQNGKMGTIVKK